MRGQAAPIRRREAVFDMLEAINTRPRPFEAYTAPELWTDPHTSARMLEFHLDGGVDVSSRRADFIDRSVDWIVERFGVRQGTRIADFGCGPGLYAQRLAEREAAVTGVDFSTRSIEYAKGVAATRGLGIQYLNQNYLEFEATDSFDLIMMIMCDYCALSPAQRRQLLERFLGALSPGGALLLDVYSTIAFAQCEETAKYEVNLMEGFWSADRYYGFLNTFKYAEEGVLLDKYTLVDASGTRTVYNWLQCFSPEKLQAEFAEAGLVVEAFYADVCGNPFDPESAEFAVVARRRAA